MLGITNKEENIVSFYIIGHDYELEIKNVYRIFDFNSKIVIYNGKEIDFNISSLIITSEMIDSLEGLSCKTVLYNDKVQLSYAIIHENDIRIEKNDYGKLKKTIVLKSLYDTLSKYFNEKSEYGFLTGIRPNKILVSSMKNNISRNDTNLILKNTYEVSDEKIKLLNEIFDRQAKYLYDAENGKKQMYNLYIHIPFCPTKCNYCSFVSYSKYDQNILNEYVNNLIYEIEKTIELAIINDLELHTIYFGGGTPSVLSVKNIDDIFYVIGKYYNLKDIAEISFEAGRPDTLDEEKLNCLKRNHVNRISINPQSMNISTLSKMSRTHSIEDIVNTYNLAKKIGFNSVNMDLIIGLPEESPDDVLNSIKKVVELRPDNITVHSLSYKKGSSLLNNSKDLSKDTNMIKEMYNITRTICSESGYKPYYMYRQKNIKGNLDNIGYALDAKESIYNIVIIEEIETILACGAGAVSKILKSDGTLVRVQNYKGLKEYNENVCKNIDEKCRKMFN